MYSHTCKPSLDRTGVFAIYNMNSSLHIQNLLPAQHNRTINKWLGTHPVPPSVYRIRLSELASRCYPPGNHSVPQSEHLFLLGDINARVYDNDGSWRAGYGHHGTGKKLMKTNSVCSSCALTTTSVLITHSTKPSPARGSYGTTIVPSTCAHHTQLSQC